MEASGLIIGGQVVPCAKPVYNWNDHGMLFKPGDGARKRIPKQVIDMMIWHWTGGSGSMEALFNVLDARDLGVEFGIDRDGDIYQFADPILVDTYDAGPYNPRSVGVEVSNYGFKGKDRPVPSRDKDRGTYETIQNGKKRVFARFYQVQLEAAVALGNAVSAAIPTIPRLIPAGADGKLYPGTMTRKRLTSFAGHLGHYHLTDSKSDPGEDLLTHMLANGYSPSTV